MRIFFKSKEYRGSLEDDKEVVEMDGDNGYMILWTYLITLMCMLENSQHDKFCYIYFETHTHRYNRLERWMAHIQTVYLF